MVATSSSIQEQANNKVSVSDDIREYGSIEEPEKIENVAQCKVVGRAVLCARYQNNQIGDS